MKPGFGAVAGWLAVALVGSVCAQSNGNGAVTGDIMRVAAATPVSGEDVFREIDDPATGNLWLLVRDQERPAGPGRLVLAPQRISLQKKAYGLGKPMPGGELPLIHTGDIVTVEEHTSVVDTRLEAVALEPSLKGAYFKVRLKIGGKVARVVAVAPGHAVFGPESEPEGETESEIEP